MSDQNVGKKPVRKSRRVLAPSQKYEMWVALLTGQATQREAAEKYGVDRSSNDQNLWMALGEVT